VQPSQQKQKQKPNPRRSSHSKWFTGHGFQAIPDQRVESFKAKIRVDNFMDVNFRMKLKLPAHDPGKPVSVLGFLRRQFHDSHKRHLRASGKLGDNETLTGTMQFPKMAMDVDSECVFWVDAQLIAVSDFAADPELKRNSPGFPKSVSIFDVAGTDKKMISTAAQQPPRAYMARVAAGSIMWSQLLPRRAGETRKSKVALERLTGDPAGELSIECAFADPNSFMHMNPAERPSAAETRQQYQSERKLEMDSEDAVLNDSLAQLRQFYARQPDMQETNVTSELPPW